MHARPSARIGSDLDTEGQSRAARTFNDINRRSVLIEKIAPDRALHRLERKYCFRDETG